LTLLIEQQEGHTACRSRSAIRRSYLQVFGGPDLTEYSSENRSVKNLTKAVADGNV